MTPVFQRIAVLGLGLLGGSLALAARSRGIAREVVGSGRRREALDTALRRGAVDAVAPPVEAVRGADLVVLCTPIAAMPAQLGAAAPALARGALVTDVGSVKGPLADTLAGLLPDGVDYVGAHPMAGSHLRGVEHARADLFDGAPCVLTPTRDTREPALRRVADFFAALGCRVVVRDPAAHDAEVGWVSHVPHALAFAFARALAAAPPRAGEVAGPGFRDFTRIARSDAGMWSDILLCNRKAVGGALRGVGGELARLADALEAGDADAVEQFLASARATLEGVARGGRDRG